MSPAFPIIAALLSSSPEAWLGDAHARVEFEVSSRDTVEAGYALRVPLDGLDAGPLAALATWTDGGWLVLPLALDTDPATLDVWFALPAPLDGGSPWKISAFFGGAVTSPRNPASIFTRYDDFGDCRFGTWVRGNDTTLQALDFGVGHRDGGCSFRFDATQNSFSTLQTGNSAPKGRQVKISRAADRPHRPSRSGAGVRRVKGGVCSAADTRRRARR